MMFSSDERNDAARGVLDDLSTLSSLEIAETLDGLDSLSR